MASAIVSGTIRVSNNANVFSKAFSALVTVSQFSVEQIILPNGASDTIVSLAHISNPGFVMLTATPSICRVNFGNLPSSTSHGSAGYQFKDLFAQIGSGISGPLALHLCNSSGDSAVVTVITGM